jgi:hypothetical protein
MFAFEQPAETALPIGDCRFGIAVPRPEEVLVVDVRRGRVIGTSGMAIDSPDAMLDLVRRPGFDGLLSRIDRRREVHQGNYTPNFKVASAHVGHPLFKLLAWAWRNPFGTRTT